MKRLRVFSLLLEFLLIGTCCACIGVLSDNTVSHSRAANDYSDDDDDVSIAPKSNKVIYDYILIPGEPAPANPATGAETPDEYNVIPLFRFRAMDIGGEPLPVRAVVILQAGYAAGANQMFFIARNLVRMSKGSVEVWVPDKRHTLMEDQTGMDLAEEMKDPYIALDYYLEGGEIGGHAYAPPDAYGSDTDMMSEWGLDLWMHDLKRIIDLVPEENRRTNVFLGGDSRGVAFTQAFAGYEFEDGSIGADHLAGLIMWDGGIRYETEIEEADYLTSLESVRNGVLPRFVQMDLDSFWFMEIFGMAASENMGEDADPTLGPNGFFPTYGPFQALIPFLTRGHNVTLTNEAFLAMVLDSDFIPYPLFMGHLGMLTGGTVSRGLLGYYPSQDGATYSWLRFNECTPEELVDTRKLVRMLYEGPSNFTDAFYSARLDADMQAAGFFETEGTWRHNHFHFFTSRVDAPVFALVSKLYEGMDLMERYRDEIAPVRGYDWPREEVGFTLIYKTDWSHLDAIAVEPDKNDVFPQLLTFIDDWSTGEVQIPTF